MYITKPKPNVKFVLLLKFVPESLSPSEVLSRPQRKENESKPRLFVVFKKVGENVASKPVLNLNGQSLRCSISEHIVNRLLNNRIAIPALDFREIVSIVASSYST